MSFSQQYFTKMTQVIASLDHAQIDRAMDLVEEAWASGRQIFTFGNGGSASTASHWVCDWNKGVSYGRDRRIRAICLNDNVATMLAYANDVSYDAVFVEPLKNFMREGDLVIGVSGSGNSRNVLRAVEWARDNGGVTLGVVGFGGGALKQLARHALHVKVDDMQIVEDLHLSFGHATMQRLSGTGVASCAFEEQRLAAAARR